MQLDNSKPLVEQFGRDIYARKYKDVSHDSQFTFYDVKNYSFLPAYSEINQDILPKKVSELSGFLNSDRELSMI